jgi:hypothetical protein
VWVLQKAQYTTKNYTSSKIQDYIYSILAYTQKRYCGYSNYVKVLLNRLTIIVLDLVSQVCDVVLMNVFLDLGDPRGSGFWNEGYMDKESEMGRSVYEQPGNKVDGILSRQGGFQVSNVQSYQRNYSQL